MSEESLFHEALSLPQAERAAFLAFACAQDPELRTAVERLLAAHENSGDFLDRPPDSGSEWTAAPTPPLDSDASAAPSAFDRAAYAQPGLVIAGRYTLVEKIGAGGMGEVWVAQQTEPVRRKVALKLIKAGTDSRSVLIRFEQERQALAIMDHPNIARVLDGGLTPGGYPYFAMELVKGVPIAEYCDANRLTPRQRLELFVPICHAIQHAHQKGIIHRDIKPSNVLVALYDDRPVPKVIDFGVAKATGPSLTDQSAHTAFGGVVGTPQYMSPEQASFNNLDVDTRSDIYSLGVLLYELLVGSPPFGRRQLDEAGVLEILRVIREDDPPRPSTKLSTADALPSLSANRSTEPKKLTVMLRGDLDWIVMKALEKDRSRRYETANGFAADVERYLAGEPVAAHPPSTAYRLRKFLRKHRGAALATALIAISLLAGIVGTTLGLISARRALQRAEMETRRAQKAEAETLADYRAGTDDAIAQLIGSKPDLGAKERAFLEKSIARWKTFAARQGEDRQSRQIRAEGHHRVGVLWGKLGRNVEALKEFEIARDLWRALDADFPGEVEFRKELAESLNSVGILYRQTGRNADAKASYEASRAVNAGLARDFPDVAEYRMDLAGNHNNLANLFAAAGEHARAETEYRAALELDRALVERFPDAQDHLQELARTRNNLALLLSAMGRWDEALTEIEAALSLRQRLVERFPNVIDNRYGLARTYNNLGAHWVRQRDFAKALPQFTAAASMQGKLAAEFPAMPRYQQDLANARNNEAYCLAELGRPDEALPKYIQARDAHAKLYERHPNAPSVELDLADAHINLGILLDDLPRRDEARNEFSAALRLAEDLVQRFPSIVAHWNLLASARYNRGNLLVNEKEYAKSLTWFAASIEAIQTARRKAPTEKSNAHLLVRAHRRRAVALDQLGRREEAAADWRQAMDLTPPGELAAIRAARAASQVRSGDVATGIAEVARLMESAPADKPWTADAWHDFAGAYAVAAVKTPSKQSEYLDRALACLRKAVDAGLRNRRRLAADPEFQMLRDHADFKKLLNELPK